MLWRRVRHKSTRRHTYHPLHVPTDQLVSSHVSYASASAGDISTRVVDPSIQMQ